MIINNYTDLNFGTSSERKNHKMTCLQYINADKINKQFYADKFQTLLLSVHNRLQ